MGSWKVNTVLANERGAIYRASQIVYDEAEASIDGAISAVHLSSAGSPDDEITPRRVTLNKRVINS